MNASDLLSLYQQRGFRLLFWERKGDGDARNWKGPKGIDARGWNDPDRVYDLSQYNPSIHNLGIFTGHEIQPGRRLIDVDLDWADGIVLSRKLLLPTSFGFGRKGKPLSHAFYTIADQIGVTAYHDIASEGEEGNGITFVELRGGDSSHMTLAAPSLHSPDIYIEHVGGTEIAHVDTRALQDSVLDYAIACIVFKHVKAKLNHDARIALAGFLLKAGLTPERVVRIGEEIYAAQMATGVSGTTHEGLHDMKLVVQSTMSRIADKSKKVAGGPKFAEWIGERGKSVVARIRKWLGVESSAIVMVPGLKEEIVNRAEEALLHQTPIYQRGGMLIRPVRLDFPIGCPGEVRREAGSTTLIRVQEPWLLEQMGRAAQWERPGKKGGILADPAPLYARTLMGRGEWRFPVLRGVLTAPTLDRSGRAIETPGFDVESGLLLDFAPGTFPPIPVAPSIEDARAALERFAAPLRGFPFVSDAARSVALSAMLTALIRPSLQTAPLHGYDAPTAGTGKSLLAEAVGLLATGTRPPALSQGKSEEEDEKRLSTVLFYGDLVIHLDNCERPVSGDFLCSMLTQSKVQVRILGLSERRVLHSNALLLASGNNLTLAGDVSRRAVMCRLDASMERPDTRKFDFDCHAEVLASRPELVVAGLTILRAYMLAGCPAELTPMGSFNDWEWVRGALVWLDCADPADTREAILENDPRKDELLAVMELWGSAFGSEAIEVAEIAKRAESIQPRDGESHENAADRRARAVALHDKLVEVACRGAWNGKSIGWWLRRNKDRVLDSRCFRSEQGQHQRWRLDGAMQRTESAIRYEGDGHHADSIPF